MFLQPDWSLPNNVKALYTTREGGVSLAPYDGFNLATHVGDNPEHVSRNRSLLIEQAGLPNSPFWLDQQHTDIAVQLDTVVQTQNESPVVADASWTQQPGCVSVVMTADCLPILLASQDGKAVAAVHAGWKGLAQGIISKTIQAMQIAPENLTAWIGPAISARQFEVGEDVYQAFTSTQPQNAAFFQGHPNHSTKFFADLPGLAEKEMKDIGVAHVQQSQLCSYENEQQFYSYRRDGITGRMASLIWIEE